MDEILARDRSRDPNTKKGFENMPTYFDYNYELLKAVKEGISTNAKMTTNTFCLAIEKGYSDVVQTIMDAGAPIPPNAVELAILSRNPHILFCVVSHWKVKITADDISFCALQTSPEVNNILIEKFEEQSVIHLASEILSQDYRAKEVDKVFKARVGREGIVNFSPEILAHISFFVTGKEPDILSDKQADEIAIEGLRLMK